MIVVQIEEVAVRSIHVFVRTAIADIGNLHQRTMRQRLGDSGVPVVRERSAVIPLLHHVNTRSVLRYRRGRRQAGHARVSVERCVALVGKRSEGPAVGAGGFAGRLVTIHGKATAEDSLAGTEDVIGKPHTRRKVEQRRLEAGDRHTGIQSVPQDPGIRCVWVLVIRGLVPYLKAWTRVDAIPLADMVKTDDRNSWSTAGYPSRNPARKRRPGGK